VGDCKAFLWNRHNGRFTDVTMGNRCTDMRDPGGRLGPYIGKDPDLRNMRLYYRAVNPGDVVVLCSDGVYDNFDPIFLGKTPRDLDLPYDGWSSVPDAAQEQKKEEFALGYARTLMQGQEISATTIVNTFLRHALNLTQRTRDFMEGNPGKKQPADYKAFPGKMDHTTCLGYEVGNGTAATTTTATTTPAASGAPAPTETP
jgi:hypothetical protein